MVKVIDVELRKGYHAHLITEVLLVLLTLHLLLSVSLAFCSTHIISILFGALHVF